VRQGRFLVELHDTLKQQGDFLLPSEFLSHTRIERSHLKAFPTGDFRSLNDVRRAGSARFAASAVDKRRRFGRTRGELTTRLREWYSAVRRPREKGRVTRAIASGRPGAGRAGFSLYIVGEDE